MEAVERLIALEGAVNFRDLAATRPASTARTRWRTLFRADGLGELTEADLAVLRALGIRTVIDLRSGEELERGRFDVDAHPVAFHHFPFIDELPDADEFERRPGLLGTQYREIVTRRWGADPGGAAGPRRIRMRSPRCSTAPPARTAPGSSPRSCCHCSGWTSPRSWPTTR